MPGIIIIIITVSYHYNYRRLACFLFSIRFTRSLMKLDVETMQFQNSKKSSISIPSFYLQRVSKSICEKKKNRNETNWPVKWDQVDRYTK